MRTARWHPGVGSLFTLAVVIVFIAIWVQVLTGSRVLSGGDHLYAFVPWSGSPGAHNSSNSLVLDPIREFVPWLGLVRKSLASGHLPLWDPFAMSGKPLLANYQSAVLSPFTLLAAGSGGAWGYSIAMLAKLWVAGLGMLVFLRLLGVRSAGATLGAISYGTCSYMVVWLAWQHSSVAALLPWVFAAVEWQLSRPSKVTFGALALVVALQFFAGHVETSLAMSEGLAIYSICRCLEGGTFRFRSLIGLVGAGVLGGVAAAVQLLPFLQQVLNTPLGSYHQGVGFEHLNFSALSSWIAPNLHGNPAIDGRIGRPPHYNESTGFAGVAALVLAAIGAVLPHRHRSAQVALVLIALYAAGIVYGPLTILMGRLPIFDVTFNVYTMMLICFAIASLAGFGFDALWARPPRRSPGGAVALAVGLAGLGGTAVLISTFVILRANAEALVPPIHGDLGFWALLAVASVLGAFGLAVAAWYRGGRLAPVSILVLALMESAVFAGPYEPQIPPAEAPPPSAVMSWLAAHAGSQRVAAVGFTMLPETSTLYGMTDVRAFDVVRPPGMKRFWSLADPAYYDDGLFATLYQPRAAWLAAAGVSYVVTPGDQPLPGTETVYQAEGATVGAVPSARSFVFAASSVSCAVSEDAAAASLGDNGPLGPVVLETATCPDASDADVHAVSSRPERIDITVAAKSPTVVVVLQSNTPDWTATVDGRSERIMPADLQFQAIAVPAGRHTVTLTYGPASVTVGLALSAAALALILVLLVSNRWPIARRRLLGPSVSQQRGLSDAGDGVEGS